LDIFHDVEYIIEFTIDFLVRDLMFELGNLLILDLMIIIFVYCISVIADILFLLMGFVFGSYDSFFGVFIIFV
jgi:hypothetical protein